MVVGFPPGNAADIVGRLVAQALADRLGQPVVVDNRPGAGGNIGTDVVAKAPPDGYTILMEVVTSAAINASFYAHLDFDFIRDIAPVASIGDGAYVVVVHPSVPARTVPEFIAYAKANPGRINMATTGNGTATHVFGSLFQMMGGVELLHVPYSGSFMPDLLRGQVQIVFGPIAQLVPHIRTGKLNALAVTTATRQATLPDVPTVAQFVPGYEASVWYGIGAPRNTPAGIIERLNNATTAALADAAVKTRFAELGDTPVAMTPAAFGKRIADETEKWRKVIQSANIRPE